MTQLNFIFITKKPTLIMQSFLLKKMKIIPIIKINKIKVLSLTVDKKCHG